MRRSQRFRLALRFLVSEPLHTATLLAVFGAALTGALIFSEVAERSNQRFIEAMTRSYGVVNIRPAEAEQQIAYPHLGHLPGMQSRWISSGLYRGVTELAEELDFSVSPRIRGAVGAPDGTSLLFLARYEEDWTADDSADAPGTRPLRVAIQRSEHATEFFELPRSSITGTHTDPRHLWIDANWLASLLNQGEPRFLATELAIMAEGDPFALAFDIRELLASRGIEATVTAWGEFLGLERYAATQSGAATERLLILLTAVLAAAGVTSVSVHNRTDITALMRTVGVSNDDIRRVYLLELMILSAVAVGVTGGLLGVFAAVGEPAMSSVTVRRTLLIGLLVPPATGFFSIRRQLRASLRAMQREALR